jgi:hypothetical protein
MEPISFDEQTCVIGEGQPQYRPLPAHISSDGTVTCCWRLTWRERLQVLLTGSIWHRIMAFRSNLQPQSLSTHRPFDKAHS